MARKKPKQAVPQSDRAPYFGLTPNQVVAFNLTQAREWRSWTQEEAAEALGRIAALVAHRVEALVREAFRDLGRWQTSLRAMANQLQQLEVRAKRGVAEEVGIDARALRVPRDAPHEAGESEYDDA